MSNQNLTKSQLKKLKAKQETEAINAKRRAMREAEETEDLLAIIPMFKAYKKNGLDITVKSHKHAPEELKTWIFELTKSCMQNYYENGNGWDDKIKNTELFEDRARYLIAYDGEKPIGFVHFRFEYDQNEYILYFYEIHIEEAYRNKGLGKFLVQACEFIALKNKVELVMCTLFKENGGSVKFFAGLNYRPHPSSPEMIDPADGVEAYYQVLWKPLIKKQ
ncbi:acetyltransferase, GNAT family protein [Trichomonas vaginalis G3]|uniref:N-alpha-acetyltransferase 40 n=1 Tax=Trichomonas vaginalis (strain ATCC PRA-98 / G3) TaxID=412133 RepID=A2DM75_TRIV3|nr:H2A histone acetyltransferase protein [Trichomonas vaginalis G3]EAY18495.1 acetyltransferase, GNAT family protein [Trichomonas vaginalis G3]KAI5489516.1 H2A histone acetyltransferase protein [Trichomonas vaginalis G3]|eukprot:XP_001579481.1 acetyltransferase, GNAT family protein [Trichomonas vaginalis G3]